MEDRDQAVRTFLDADKMATGRLRWLHKRHQDYVEAKSPLVTVEEPVMHGSLRLTAHLFRRPPKYGFSMIFRGRRRLGLDVNPGASHTNILRLESVRGTHWQEWPSMDAVADSRGFFYSQWLDAFMKRAHIQFKHPYRPPPIVAGKQPGLWP